MSDEAREALLAAAAEIEEIARSVIARQGHRQGKSNREKRRTLLRGHASSAALSIAAQLRAKAAA